MRVQKKPRPPRPGAPEWTLSCYEVKQTLSTLGHSSATVAVSLLSFAAMFGTKENVDMLWAKETAAGTIGVIVISCYKLFVMWRGNNTGKKA